VVYWGIKNIEQQNISLLLKVFTQDWHTTKLPLGKMDNTTMYVDGKRLGHKVNKPTPAWTMSER